MAKDKEKELAKILYLHGYTQKDIAQKVGATEKTLSKWVNEGKWESLKKNRAMTKNERLSELYDELAEINNVIKSRDAGLRYPTAAEADTRRKIIKDISELETKYSISETISVGMDFVEFCREIDFDFAQKALSYFSAFTEKKIELQKWQE